VSICSLEIAKDASKLIMGNSAGYFIFWECEGAKKIVDANSESKKVQYNYGKVEDFNPMQEVAAHPN
jgi:G protein beta subunit-like protein